MIEAGVPAVVAMQDFVTVQSARLFSGEFYRRLLEHDTVDLAVNEARDKLLTEGRHDAAVPVLFMRLQDGRLWQAPAARPLELNALHQLPAPPRDFTGRTADLDAILNDIERGAVISGVRGMGGIGKTALALVIADQLKAQYPDAQFFIDLRGASDQPLKPLDAMRSVIRAYHPTAQLPDDATQIAALYRSVLDGQRAIVLLDDAKDTAQITPLLPPASCLVLVTTRNRFAVPGLTVKDLKMLSPTDAYDLLIAIAPRLSPHPNRAPAVRKEREPGRPITPLRRELLRRQRCGSE